MLKLTILAALFAALAAAEDRYRDFDGRSDMQCNSGTTQISDLDCVFGEYVYCCTKDLVPSPGFPTHRKCSGGKGTCTVTDPSGKVLQGVGRCC
ncbi:hypothetical protein CTRI78_v004431 [Colletotrichum trifolii]|uniref:Uncharacterized protein n=1 Tax=Colletotrichum trifolii TaxID=5466 RepID=A0A4R8RTN4_COLTR|nr:hypothetical protein CTRI78_v004431 [Colletotrichum trifolii]